MKEGGEGRKGKGGEGRTQTLKVCGFFVFEVLKMEPRASLMLGKYSALSYTHSSI
jgi:hypothetical protein